LFNTANVNVAVPNNHKYMPNNASRGSAISRAPICPGTAAIATPSNTGASTPNTAMSRARTTIWVLAISVKITDESAIRSNPTSAPSAAATSNHTDDAAIVIRPI